MKVESQPKLRPISALHNKSMMISRSSKDYEFPELFKKSNLRPYLPKQKPQTKTMIGPSSPNKFTTTNNIIPVNSIEKLYEDYIGLRSTSNFQFKEIIGLKCEIAKKDNEIQKNNKMMKKIIEMESAASSIIDVGSMKESQLVSKLKSQFRDLKAQYKLKENEVESLKKSIKNTKIQEILNENQILKEELIKVRNKMREIQANSKRNQQQYMDFLNLQEKYTQLNIEYSTLKENFKQQESELKRSLQVKQFAMTNRSGFTDKSKFKNIDETEILIGSMIGKNDYENLLDEIKFLFGTKQQGTPHNPSLSKKSFHKQLSKAHLQKTRSEIETIVSSSLNIQVSSLSKELAQLRDLNSSLITQIKSLELKLKSISEVQKEDKQIQITKQQETVKENLIYPKKLTELSQNTKSQIKGKLKPKKLRYNLTEINTGALDEFEKQSKKEKSYKPKPKLLDEDELNEFTYILIKNLEVMGLTPEQLEEVINH